MTSNQSAPITYMPNFIHDPDEAFDVLWGELPWERRPDAPRRECWMNDYMRPYTYGRGAGERTYRAVAWHPLPRTIRDSLAAHCGHLDACFINGYEGPRDHLGWHADDSPEIDDGRHIAVVSLGSARRIQFREKGSGAIEDLILQPGSLLLMHPGMQDTHEHRIPKHGANCGARISLTYRGLVAA